MYLSIRLICQCYLLSKVRPVHNEDHIGRYLGGLISRLPVYLFSLSSQNTTFSISKGHSPQPCQGHAFTESRKPEYEFQRHAVGIPSTVGNIVKINNYYQDIFRTVAAEYCFATGPLVQFRRTFFTWEEAYVYKLLLTSLSIGVWHFPFPESLSGRDQ